MNHAQKVVLPPDREPKFLGIFIKERSFYRAFIPLLVIIALQHLAALMVNMVDNLMLGSYTELALSGATLVNQIHFVMQELCSGIGMGIVVLASQYWGQQRIEPIKKIISMGIKMAFVVGVIFFLLSQFAPVPVMSFFTNDAAVIAEGAKYLAVIGWTYLIFSISNSLMYSLQSVQTAAIGTVMSCSTIGINLILNYCLIFGNFGFPELGIVGAAVATLVSRSVELVIILVYVLFVDKKLHMKLIDLLRLDLTYFKDFIRVALPVTLSAFLWGIAQAVQSAVLGHISATTIAANSIAVVIANVFAVFGMSNAGTASIIMGKTVGEGRFHVIRAYAKTMQGLFLLIGICTGVLLFLFKDLIVGFYAVSPETKELAVRFLIILSITTVGSCYEFPCESGIIAGGGTTKYAPLVDNLFMWLWTIPASAISAFVFHVPPEVTFMILKSDQLFKCIPNSIVTNRYRWVRILTKDDPPAETGEPEI